MWLVECDKIGNVDQNLAKAKELEEYILKTQKIRRTPSIREENDL